MAVSISCFNKVFIALFLFLFLYSLLDIIQLIHDILEFVIYINPAQTGVSLSDISKPPVPPSGKKSLGGV